MAIAAIIFQQNSDGYAISCSRDDLVLGSPVTVLNQDNSSGPGGIVVQWNWLIVDKPSGSTATLAAPTASTTTFTPDIVGTYLIHLLVSSDGGSPVVDTDQKGAAIKTANLNYRIPAATETTEFDVDRGWATATNSALKTIDDSYVAPVTLNLQNTYNLSNPARIIVDTTNGGMQIQDASSPSGGSIFEVDSYGAITKYLKVTPDSSTFTGKILQTGGPVGFGTITPGSGYTNIIPDLSLHLYKTGHNMLLIDTLSSNSDSGIIFYTLGASTDSAIFLDESDSRKFKLAMGAVDSDANRITNTKLTIQQDGYVGIGTTSPTSKLHVIGDAHFTAGFSSDANSSMGGYRLTAVADPITGSDAATKDYVDGYASNPISIDDNSNLLLTTTSLTNVVSYTPLANGDFIIYLYHRVITGDTDLTVDITWEDGTGAQTYSIIPTSTQIIGSYSSIPLYVTANTSAPITVTATAATANRIYVSSSIMSLASSTGGNDPRVAEKADIFDYQLTTTSLTNVLSFTPVSNENFFVYIYYRVSNTTTDVTIDLTFNDIGGAQTLSILPLTSKAVGSYSISPVYIQATTAAPINVSFTSGTANNVYVSATILLV